MTFRDDLQTALFGRSTSQVVESKSCVTCDHPDLEFTNARERREYYISGMCANCQREEFGGTNPE